MMLFNAYPCLRQTSSPPSYPKQEKYTRGSFYFITHNEGHEALTRIWFIGDYPLNCEFVDVCHGTTTTPLAEKMAGGYCMECTNYPLLHLHYFMQYNRTLPHTNIPIHTLETVKCYRTHSDKCVLF